MYERKSLSIQHYNNLYINYSKPHLPHLKNTAAQFYILMHLTLVKSYKHGVVTKYFLIYRVGKSQKYWVGLHVE